MEILEQNTILRKETEHSVGQFSIKPSAKAFKILIDQLYTNPIRACIRELSSNAIDANVAANVTDPISVHIPTYSELYFSVTDKGIGMSADDIVNTFTVIFESSKTGTNTQIGGFGLGSKTPFAYGDRAFTVTSCKNGRKVCYQFFIDSNDIPSYVKVFDEETTEVGTEVRFNVKSGDTYAFEKECVNIYSWYETKPTTNKALGYTKYNLTKITDQVSINKYSDSYYARHLLLMGNNVYNININDSGLTPIDDSRHCYLIKCNIGEVDITPDRENINFSPKTKVFFKNVNINFLNNVKISIQNEINTNCKNLYEAIKYEWEHNVFNIPGIEYNGEIIRDKKKISALSLDIKIYNDFQIDNFDLSKAFGKTIYWSDIRGMSYYKQNKKNSYYFVMTEDQKDKLVKYFGHDFFEPISSLRTLSGRLNNYQPVTKCMKVIGYGNLESVETPDGGYYCLREGKSIDVDNFKFLLPEDKVDFYAFTKSEIKKLDKTIWFNINDYLSEKMKEYTDYIENNIHHLNNKVNNSLVKSFNAKYTEVFANTSCKEIKPIELEEVDDTIALKVRELLDKTCYFVDNAKDKKRQEISKLEEKITGRYPMLGYNNLKTIQVIMYVKQVDFWFGDSV